MDKLTSKFASRIESMLSTRHAFGYKREPYESLLTQFDLYCKTNHPKTKVLTREVALEWIGYKADSSVKVVKSKVMAMRAFGKYLESIGETEAFIIPENFTPKHHAKTPYLFTDIELRKFFYAVDNFNVCSKDKFIHIILPVILRMIYTCGLRPKEARELRVNNINLRTGEVLIQNAKYHKERVVVMSDDMTELCRAYLAKRLIMRPNGDILFPDLLGNIYTNNKLNYVFQQCWQNANPDIDPSSLPKVRIYDLRHRFASAILCKWINEKKNLFAMLPYLRTYMGHSDISATAYYIHILPENIMSSNGVDWESMTTLLPEVDIWPE